MSRLRICIASLKHPFNYAAFSKLTPSAISSVSICPICLARQAGLLWFHLPPNDSRRILAPANARIAVHPLPFYPSRTIGYGYRRHSPMAIAGVFPSRRESTGRRLLPLHLLTCLIKGLRQGTSRNYRASGGRQRKNPNLWRCTATLELVGRRTIM